MKQKVRHIVMFDFSNLTAEIIKSLIIGFKNLKKQIPEIMKFEWGTVNNVEGSSLGFTHCFILTFAEFSAVTRYLNHPQHREYENEVKKLCNKILVFDYLITE